jgi:hypothetical protein
VLTCPEKFREDSHGIYVVASLEPHMMYIAMMMCRLYGKENTAHFFLPWVPIMHTVADGYSFDWAKILSDNLVREITKYQSLRAKGKPAPFFMSAYIMDVVCFMTPFPLMGWSWTPTSVEPIHFYHSKLWEDKARDFFYEICNYVVVSMHIAIYGCPPPRISDKIVTNLGKIADWYIEEHFSYIRVFGCSVPPHALPKFLPDRLVCRKVAHQTVLGGISKELKAVQKKVWPTFPLQIGRFTLLDFGHSKVEATALEDIKLVNIEFKKHDPQRIVGNHMALSNLKIYEHEYSPQDEIFRGVRSYQEVLSRVQTLAPDKLAEFHNFQRHRRNGLPKVLQGETPTPPATQKVETQSLEAGSSSGQDAQEHLEKTEVVTQKWDTTLTNPPDDQTKTQAEALIKKVEEKPPSTPGKSATDTTGQ